MVRVLLQFAGESPPEGFDMLYSVIWMGGHEGPLPLGDIFTSDRIVSSSVVALKCTFNDGT